MNKKAIAIDVIKHPIIKKLLESKIATTSTINKLIIEEVLGKKEIVRESAFQNKIKNKKLKNVALQTPSAVIDNASKLQTSPDGPKVSDIEQEIIQISKDVEQTLTAIKTLVDNNKDKTDETEKINFKQEFGKLYNKIMTVDKVPR